MNVTLLARSQLVGSEVAVSNLFDVGCLPAYLLSLLGQSKISNCWEDFSYPLSSLYFRYVNSFLELEFLIRYVSPPPPSSGRISGQFKTDDSAL